MGFGNCLGALLAIGPGKDIIGMALDGVSAMYSSADISMQPQSLGDNVEVECGW